MGVSGARKLLLVLVITACVFSETADAWSWSWSSGRSGSHWSWGWGSDSGSSGSGSGGGSSWGWGWSSNGTTWGWGISSGSHHSNGTGPTHKSHHNHTASSNHSSGGVGSPPHNHPVPSNPLNNHTAPSNHSSGSVGSPNNHTAPSNHSSGSVGSASTHDQTAPIPPTRQLEVTVWKRGFHYKKWASKHAPFYVNDVVAFKFNNKNKTTNDVYLLPNLRSYMLCDVSEGRKLVPRNREAWSLKSGGFTFLLRRAQIYYFVSGDHTSCNHNMKFALFAHKP